MIICVFSFGKYFLYWDTCASLDITSVQVLLFIRLKSKTVWSGIAAMTERLYCGHFCKGERAGPTSKKVGKFLLKIVAFHNQIDLLPLSSLRLKLLTLTSCSPNLNRWLVKGKASKTFFQNWFVNWEPPPRYRQKRYLHTALASKQHWCFLLTIYSYQIRWGYPLFADKWFLTPSLIELDSGLYI